MQKTLITAAAVAATLVAMAAPAVSNAAPLAVRAHVAVVAPVDFRDNGRFNDHRGFDNRASVELDRRIAELSARINSGHRGDGLSFRESARLNDRLNAIKWSKRDAERSGRGLSGQETASLNARLDDLQASVYGQRHDGNRW